MGLNDPKIGESRPFSEALKEGEPFILDGIRTVKVSNTEYGEGTMVLLKVRGQDKELSIWGSYLVAQAESAESDDFRKRYVIERKVVPGFSQRPVKALVLDSQEEIPF